MKNPTTTDVFLGGALRITQPAQGYRAGMDALLLAAAVAAPPAQTAIILDVGSGVGTVGLAVAHRLPNALVALAEVDPDLLALAHRNIIANRLGHRMTVHLIDVTAGGAALHDTARSTGLRPGAFTRVVSNPPYYDTGSALRPTSPMRARAHQMPASDLDAWIAFMATAACSDGQLTMIHRAEALPRLLEALTPRFGAIRLRPLQSRAETPANRILVTGIKGSRAPITIVPALVVHGEAGNYRPEIDAILRGDGTIVI